MTVYFIASVAFLVLWFVVLIRYFNLPLAAVLCLSAFGLGASFPFLVVRMGLQESLVLYALLIPITGTGIFYLNRHVFESAFVPAGQPAPVDAEAVYAVEDSIINGQTTNLKEDIREEGRIQEDSEDSAVVESLQGETRETGELPEETVLVEESAEVTPEEAASEPSPDPEADLEIALVEPVEHLAQDDEPEPADEPVAVDKPVEVLDQEPAYGEQEELEVQVDIVVEVTEPSVADEEPVHIEETAQEAAELIVPGANEARVEGAAEGADEVQPEEILPDQVSLSMEDPEDKKADGASLSSEDLVSVAVRLTTEGEYEEAMRLLERILLTIPAVETLCLAVAEMSTVYQHLGQYRMAADLLKVFLDDPETSAHRLSSLLVQKMRFSEHLDELLREAGTAELPYHQVPPELVEQAFSATARI